jgi:hypothetical protein
MNRNTSSRDNYERDAYLNDIEETHFFDVDSGIYKPKSCRTETASMGKKRGTSPSTPLFVRPSSDGAMLAVASFSAIVAFATFLAVLGYTWVANRQLKEMHDATVATGNAADTAQNTLLEMQKEQRPWILVKSGTITVLEPSKKIAFDVGLSNFGHSPAFQTKAVAQLYVTSPSSAV